MSIFFHEKPLDFVSDIAVSTVFIEYDNKILFLQRARHKICPSQWAVPGGKLEKGETPLEGLIREIQEELQVSIPPNNLEFIELFYVRNIIMEYMLYLYYWKLSAPIEVILCKNEHQDYKWQPIHQCDELNLIEGQHEAFIRACQIRKTR